MPATTSSFPTVPLLIALNILVFFAWTFYGAESRHNFMADNFLVSWIGLLEGRYWTLITSVFSHSLFLHLLLNMFVLRSFGPIMEQTLGTKIFLSFYFLAAVVSSLSHVLVSAFLLHQPELPALGASGAISGLILLFALMFPKQKILLFAIIPMPALVGALVFIGLDLWGLFEQTEGGGLPIGHGAHLGGALAGIVFYFLYIKKRWRTVGYY